MVAPAYYEDHAREDDDGYGEMLLINANAKFQITSLDEATPLFKISENATVAADPETANFSNLSAIDGQIFQTKWRKLLGTEMVFDDHGDLVGTVREHLEYDPSIRIKPAPGDDEQASAEAEEELDATDSKTAFLKKAIALARAKADAGEVGATEPNME